MAVIQGKAFWASVQSPNDKFPPPVYCIDVVVTDEVAAGLRADGLTVTDKEGQGLTLKAKRAQFRKDGTLNTKPNVVDANKRPMEDLVGNGSLVNLQYNPFNWEFAGKKGRSADLVGVQVLELVEFTEGGGKDEFVSADPELEASDEF